MRKTAATTGLPKITRKRCSNSRPAMATGMVARMIIQASRSLTVSICRWRMDVKNPPMIRIQSRQK
jgi:hypothetical protein